MILKVAMPGSMPFKLIRREPAFFMAKEGEIHYIGAVSYTHLTLPTNSRV